MRVFIFLFLVGCNGIEDRIGPDISLDMMSDKSDVYSDNLSDTTHDFSNIDQMVLVNLSNPTIVCQTCSDKLLLDKTSQIKLAMEELKVFLETDISVPIVFHLDGDEFCGYYSPGDFSYVIIGKTQADVCLFEIEKEIDNSILHIHETIHVWFSSRITNYALEEPFCKITSFFLTGSEGCSWFYPSFSYPDRLMYDLCGLGMSEEKLRKIFRTVGNHTLTVNEFVDICSLVLGKDSTWAFKNAGL